MKTDLLYSPTLRKGDLVRLVSPASYPEQAHVQDYIRTLEQWGLCCDAAVSAPVEFPGSAQGQLIGGNLQMLATSMGVRIPPMRGAILFLEYHRAGLGTIDRYLTQLVRSGALDGIAGVALGSFECARDYVDRGWNVVDVLNDRLGQLGVPVLGGLCAGHDLTDELGNNDRWAIPLGSLASLNVGKGTLAVESVMK